MKPTFLISLLVVVTVSIGVYSFMQNQAPSTVSSSSTQTVSTNTSNQTGAYTLADIATHASASDCWTAVDGKVYDVTSFIPSHPGGQAIVRACGKDGTSLFQRVRQHESQNAEETMDSLYLIGTLKG